MHRITTARRARRVASALVCAGLALGMTGCAEDPQPSLPPAAAPEEPTTTPAQTTGIGGATPGVGASSGGGASSTGGPSASASPSLSGEFERDADGYPLMPATAKKNTKAGAEAFARWYLELIGSITMKPRPGVLSAHAAPTCKSCANYEQMVSTLASRGERADAPITQLKPTRFVGPGNAGNGWIVEVPKNQRSVNQLDRNGEVMKKTKAGSSVMHVWVTFASGAWKVREMQIEKQE